MVWYRHSNITAITLTKVADVQDIVSRSLSLLNGGVHSSVISNMFINQMKAEDPTFDANQLAGLNDTESLRNYLQGFGGAAPVVPVVPPAGEQAGDIDPIQWPDNTAPETPTDDIGPIQWPEEETPTEVPPPPTTPEGIVPQEEIVDEPQTTTQEQMVEEVEIAEDIQEEERGVLREDREGEYDHIDIAPQDMLIEKGMEVVNPIPQREFSIPAAYLPRLQSSIKKITDYRDEQGQAPMAIRFITEDGVPSSKPVIYQKEAQSPGGETFFVDYLDFVLEGEPPNPLGDTVKKIKNQDGSVSRKEVIYQIIAFLELLPVEGFEPKEERFPTQEKAARHVAAQGDPLWAAGKKNKDKNTGEVFFPSTYKGKWRTVIERYPNTPVIDDRFKQGNPLDCDHCGRAMRGKTARKSVFVAIEYPAEQLRTQKGERREPTPAESSRGKQVQIGTSCVSKHRKALDFIHDLENLKIRANSTENIGRDSNAFGGSMKAPKSLPQVMSNYLAARKYSPGRGGNWFKRRWGGEFSPSDLKKFKSYYFGHKRSAMRAAAIEMWKYERDMEDWEKEARKAAVNGVQAPTKPLGPPAGPEPFPWKETSEDDDQKAEDIINWWKEKKDDPTIDLGEEEGLETHNTTSIALNGKINSKYFEKMVEMVRSYEKEEKRKKWEAEKVMRDEEQRIRGEERRTREEEQALTDNVEFDERRLQDQQRTEDMTARGLDDITQVIPGAEFKSSLKHKRSIEWSSRKGMMHDFEDSQGNIYRIFDRYKKDPMTSDLVRESGYDFTPGEDYVIQGEKGELNTRYRNTTINKPKVVLPGDEGGPGGIPPMAEEVPEIAPEAPAMPEVAPEAPIEREPTESTILGGEDRDKQLERIGQITDFAKNVVETGKTRDTQDAWGQTIPGREMSPDELIPLYLDQISKIWPPFDKEDFTTRLTNSYLQGDKIGLLKQLKFVPIMLRNLI